MNTKEVPMLFGYAPMVVITESMDTGERDSIAAGDLVIAKKVDTSSLKKGDIIMFQSDGTTVIHRIIGRNKETGEFITKGDANNTADIKPVDASAVVGRYTLKVRSIGRFILFAKNPLGLLICLGVPVLMFFIYDIASKWQCHLKIKKEKGKYDEG